MICVINMVVYSIPSGTYYKFTLIFCNDELGVLDEGYSRNVARTKFYIYVFITITESTSAGGLFVPECTIRPVISASALTWFVTYIVIEIHVIIIKVKVLLSQA